MTYDRGERRSLSTACRSDALRRAAERALLGDGPEIAQVSEFLECHSRSERMFADPWGTRLPASDEPVAVHVVRSRDSQVSGTQWPPLPRSSPSVSAH